MSILKQWFNSFEEAMRSAMSSKEPTGVQYKAKENKWCTTTPEKQTKHKQQNKKGGRQ